MTIDEINKAIAEESDFLYLHQDLLMPGQVFERYDDPGDVVRLDRRVPGDGIAWYADVWSKGVFYNDDAWIEPGDLTKRLPDNFGAAL